VLAGFNTSTLFFFSGDLLLTIGLLPAD